MSAQQLFLVCDSSTYANYAAWASPLSAWFATCGWLQGTDTGQVMWSGMAAGKHQPMKTSAGSTSTPSGLAPVPVGGIIQSGVVGAFYSETLTTNGGSSPYVYSVLSGSLPAGLSLSAGIISGTPTTTGTSTFTIKVVDGNGSVGTQSLSIVIISSSPAFGFI